jgi:quinol monooxygenase YgiN
MSVLSVTAVIRVKPGEEEPFLEAGRRVLEPTRREEGCVDYRLHRSTESPGMFVFYENWRSRDDLDRHLETPHIQGFITAIDPMLEAPIELSYWEEIS